MIGEINIGGVFIPSIVIWSIIAFVILYLIRRILAYYQCYQWIWQQALFNTALFIILLGGITFLVTALTF
jgi:Protein of unknown function (DUF1656)